MFVVLSGGCFFISECLFVWLGVVWMGECLLFVWMTECLLLVWMGVCLGECFACVDRWCLDRCLFVVCLIGCLFG